MNIRGLMVQILIDIRIVEYIVLQDYKIVTQFLINCALANELIAAETAFQHEHHGIVSQCFIYLYTFIGPN